MKLERAVTAVTNRWYDYVAVTLAVTGVTLTILWYISWPQDTSEVVITREPLREGEPEIAGARTRGEILSPSGASNALLLAAVGAWIGFIGTVAFKGYVRRMWTRSYFDYDVFRLLVRMRGAKTRVEILRRLEEPMNRNQLAEELKMDWKSVDRHVEILSRYGLIERVDDQGWNYRLTENGRRVLELLEELAKI
ncbi:MAG: winged helix-turn-helix domain-containing protein [Thaumarchaeota archaeon]|nr:winged helix-turn-helix domain-containing protein [Candidatus Calditenuaceae archaeon]MDW8041682.1 winged helix-turn-helix domain-containing protein [Nitrososphaerota archaeon]